MPTRKPVATDSRKRKSGVKSKTAHPPARKTTQSRKASSPSGRQHAPVIRLSRRVLPRHKSRPLLGSISPERQMDILGIVLALLGLLTSLALLSSTRGSLTGWWVDFLASLFGWGSYALPAALFVVGVWLVLRNVEKLPQLAAERLAGIILLFVNILAFLHLFAGGTLETAAAGQGGGYIGGWVLQLLLSAVGKPGAIIILCAWLVVALGLTLDLSVPELFRWALPLVSRSRQIWQALIAQIESKRAQPQAENWPSDELPPSYSPFSHHTEEDEVYEGEGNRQLSTAQEAAPVVDQGDGKTPPWVLPPVEAILEPGSPVAVDDEIDQQRGHVIEETLASFGAPAHVVEIHRGPTITQFGVEPEFIENRAGRTRVRVSKIVSLADDLALALAAQRIRIQAPVPGRAYVGIEVPNTEVARVALRDVIESDYFQKMRSPLRIALGKDVAGKPVATDLASMPHLLIAGTTGSGKSVCVNAILSCLMINNTPDDVRLILVDPKRVELTGYNGVPHLLAPVVVDADRVVGALQWMMREMDNRYHKFAQVGARNIIDYNTRLQAQGEKKIPYLVVVIDELADLMMMAPDETERTITRLAQLARATGLHLIIATQRPSVDVLTGLIKANFPARIAFAVASGVDSRVILDQPGAERLLGRGDMLFQAPDAPAPARLQGVYVSDGEIQRLVNYWRGFAILDSESSATQGEQPTPLPPGTSLKQAALWEDMSPVEDEDPLLNEAIDLVRREGRASISMLQRRMRIGYTRAARMVDRLEEKGIIGPSQTNSQVRQILDYGPTAPPAEE